MTAAKGEQFEEQIGFAYDFCGDDFDRFNLQTQLSLLEEMLADVDHPITVPGVIERLRQLTKSQRALLSEVFTLAKLYLVVPATNTISERSGSTLRRIRTYLRTTMCQSLLSHCMLLNIYKEALDELSLIDITNEFCSENGARLNMFGTFAERDTPHVFQAMVLVATQT